MSQISCNAELDTRLVNTVRALVIDGVKKARSGHTGGALSSAPFLTTLYSEFLRFSPQNPSWIGRDRFVLSAGHESMLLYSILHMSGILSIEDLKNFRQYGSVTPGHPEPETPGIDFGTGPLGQGAATSVGMALGAKHLSASLSRDLFSYKVFSLLGDGCIEEDVAINAASLAGHWKLGNLIWYYDNNGVQIDGRMDLSTSTDIVTLFKSMNWDTVEIDGSSVNETRSVLEDIYSKERTRPLLIIDHTIMAQGSYSMEGSSKSHGTPFTDEEASACKKKWGMDPGASFVVEDDVRKYFQRDFLTKEKEKSAWDNKFNSFIKDPVKKQLWDSYFNTTSIKEAIKGTSVEFESKPISTREAFGKSLNAISKKVPSIIGGSADLAGSNGIGSFVKENSYLSSLDYSGRAVAYGVREFPMGCISNGLALLGLRSFCTTFLVFSDYLKPALRLSALEDIPVIYGFSHDSFYVGEDGPTHQPVEQLMSLRAVPRIRVYRPSDARETHVLLCQAIEDKVAAAFCVSRQNLDQLSQNLSFYEGACRGGYFVYTSPDISGYSKKCVIYATGSEVSLAVRICKDLEEKGVGVYVVALPCWEVFDEQDEKYKATVMMSEVKYRVSIEAGTSLGWSRFTGSDGLNICLNDFGKSAPSTVLEEKFGFSPKAVLDRILKYIL